VIASLASAVTRYRDGFLSQLQNSGTLYTLTKKPTDALPCSDGFSVQELNLNRLSEREQTIVHANYHVANWHRALSSAFSESLLLIIAVSMAKSRPCGSRAHAITLRP
jgi:hypothetical protein